MTKNELLNYLKEEASKTITGWDFSYLNGRWEEDDLPWNYETIVKEYLKSDFKLLDIGTGGGEKLLSLNHPFENTSVTEGYEPNYKICMEKLAPLGVNVYYYVGDEEFNEIPDEQFDIVINRQESYNEKELFRILKPNGIFITQQVGALNNYDLRKSFDENYVEKESGQFLVEAEERLKDNGFEIILSDEYFPRLKFLDLGALAYFVSIIKWEFPNLDVEDKFDKFLLLKEELDENGYILSVQHRYLIVSKKVNNI